MMSREYGQIAIDGPAASGKSTVARLLASMLGGVYVSTGEMYRTLAWGCLRDGINPAAQPDKVTEALPQWRMDIADDGVGGIRITFNGKLMEQSELRSPEVSAIVSDVARIRAVRTWLLERQRECQALGLVIMEGRDIGTVVLPDATCKVFITASPLERARRRFKQGGESIPGATLEAVAAGIARRDQIDSTRKVAPLRAADDAVTIVTDGMSADAVAARIADIYRCRAGERRS